MTLPTSGVVYVDSVALIYTMDRHQTYAPRLDQFWRSVAEGHVRAVVSELAVMECLVIPLRVGEPEGINRVERFLASSLTVKYPVDRSVLIGAALVRAKHKVIRTPDAIHLATASVVRADYFLTNDRKLLSACQMKVILIDELT